MGHGLSNIVSEGTSPVMNQGKKQKKPKQIAVGFLLSKRAKIPRPMERLDWCIRIETNMTSRN